MDALVLHYPCLRPVPDRVMPCDRRFDLTDRGDPVLTQCPYRRAIAYFCDRCPDVMGWDGKLILRKFHVQNRNCEVLNLNIHV